MSQLGPLVARLRKERGLTQTELANAVLVDKETIAQVEQGRRPSWRPATAKRIFEELSKHGPIRPEDAAQFTESTGVITPTPGRTQEDVARQRLHRLVDDLVAVAGHQPIANILIALSEAMEVERRLSSSQSPGLVVKHPPVQREGYVEQVEVDYPPAPAQRPASGRPRAKRAQ